MPHQLLGDRALPNSVQSRRQSLRSRLNDLRSPIRNRRESSVPGPDLIGRGEDTLTSARRKIVTRESPVGNILSRVRNGGGSSSDSGSSGDGSNSSSGSNEESDAERRSNSLV